MSEFAPRSLIVYKLEVTRRGKPNDRLDVTDVDGFGLVELFTMMCDDGDKDRLLEIGTTRYISVPEHRAIDDYSTLAKLRSGTSGEKRDVFNVETSSYVSTINEDEAAMTDSRVYLTAKGTGRKYALLCVEHSPSAAGDTAIPKRLREYMKDIVPKVVLRYEAVVEGEALDKFVSVEQIEVRKYLPQDDIADAVTSEARSVSIVLNHPRGKPFDISNIHKMIEMQRRGGTLYGISEIPLNGEDTDVLVKLKDRNGSVRQFLIDSEYEVKVREVLNAKGQPPVGDDEFVSRCVEKCQSIAGRLGRMI